MMAVCTSGHNPKAGRLLSSFSFSLVPATVAVLFTLTPPGVRAQRPLGIDVSSFQGTITWSSIPGDGLSFAWAKATEGLSYQDAYFVGNENGGKGAGVLMGAYHYCHPELNSASSEATYFWNFAGSYIKNDGKTLMPMLDVEGNAFSGNVGASSLSAWVNQWGGAVSNSAYAAGAVIKPVVYISACNVSGHLDTSIASTTIPWIADYNGADPQSSTPWTTCTSGEIWGSGVWTVWQYTSTGGYTGISGNVDHDVFNGTSSSLITTLVAASAITNYATLAASYGIPGSVYTGATFVASITFKNSGTYTWTNTGSPYQLGSQSPSGNTTWGLSTVALPSSPIAPGASVTFSFTATAPMTTGARTFAWRMINGSSAFGDTFSTSINVVTTPTTSGGTWWGNADITPTTLGHPGTTTAWATTNDCSQGTYWYIYSHYTSCTGRTFYMNFNPGFVWNGRGYIHMDWLNTGSVAGSILTMHYLNQLGNQTGETATHNDCAGPKCAFASIKDAEVADVYQYNGIYRTADEDTSSTCGNVCGFEPSAGREMHMYGDKWVYLNDWVTFGGFGNATGVSTVGWTPPFGESGVYVYGAIDTTHGNYFANNLFGGHAPYRVQTGDCGANTTPGSGSYPNYINFKGNAGLNGNNNCDNCDAYAFAWVQAGGSGAGPQWGVGSDDGNRVWLNGTLIHDNNVARGMTWDQDRFLPAGMNAGWNAVLLKVHNGGVSFSGVVSLHNGSDFHQIEQNVYMQPDRFTGFSTGYEQDSWYPTITPTTFYHSTAPVNGSAYYSNSTSVFIAGASGINPGSPVPYWRTMQYQWGYGMAGDSNYADVSGTATSTTWSHNQTGVTGHRRFYLFAVSQSGRTSFQSNGKTGGSTYSDTGNYARYYDVYVDNVAPVTPAFSSVTVAGTNQINLTWTIPLDQGINIANSATEASTGIASGGANGYVRGDVGVQVYRDAGIISNWGTSTSMNDTGLSANTSHTYTIEARDNNGGSRGAWNNLTGPQGSTMAWTLSSPPASGSVTPDSASPPVGGAVHWTAVGGFGAGTIQYYRYAWDTSATHTWTGSEPQWSSSTLATVPTSTGSWYLHVQGYNGADVANGSFDYPVNAVRATSGTALASSQNPSAPGSNVTFTATVSAVTGSGTPTGNVVFSANGSPFSTNALVSGSANASTVFPLPGTNTVAAQYGGDASFVGSSATLQQIVETTSCSQTNVLLGISANTDGSFTLTFLGTPQASYYVVGNSNVVGGTWAPLQGSTNLVNDPNGYWQVTVSNSALQQFYRSVAINPCP